MAAEEDEWDGKGIAARWTPGHELEHVPVRQGRAPAMTYLPWQPDGQGLKLEFGMTSEGTFWRCREPRCRRFAGPYRDGFQGHEEGWEHRRLVHPPRPRAARSRAAR